MTKSSGKILVVESRFYNDIAEALWQGAVEILKADGQTVERVTVPGVFEIPSAVQFAWQSDRFDGCVTLGCVIRGETDHYDHICREVSRKLMDLVVKHAIPHGFGILTCENIEQAWERADRKPINIGARASKACLQMLKIKMAFNHRE